MARLIGSVVVFLFFLSGCKDDIPEPLTFDNLGKPTYKRTEFTLAQPEFFPPFPQQIILTKEIVNLGRHLFYEKKLSGDGTQSCASCHNQEWAFSDNGKQFSEGIDGSIGDKNAMAIINLAYGNGFFWDGRSTTLEKQAIEPVINPIEMHNTWKAAINTLKGDTFYVNRFYEAFGTDDWDSTHAAEAIAQFEKTMLSSQSPFDDAVKQAGGLKGVEIFLRRYSEDVYNGYLIFNREPRKTANSPAGGDCFHCHSADNMLFTDNKFQNNGLDANPDEGLMAVTGLASDKGKFKTTTLRNIANTAPYMHDGRFKTLEEVVEFYNSKVVSSSPNLAPIMKDGGGGIGIVDGLNLTKDEKDDLIAFLKALSDPEFMKNADFSDPK
jgi:cytochrome c peroxidase